MKNLKIVILLFFVLLFSCKEEEVPEHRIYWPKAEFLSPVEDSFYLIGDEIEIEVNATDPFGEVARVDILVENTTLTSLTSSPYTYIWDTKDQTKGEKTLSAIVYGADDEKGTGTVQIDFLENVLDTVSDYDGNIYKTVVIGEQRWMARNLRTTHYSDGEPVQKGESIDSLKYMVNPIYYFDYTLNSGVITECGLTYTWDAIMNGKEFSNSVPSEVQGICPNGYHLPSDEEWKILERFCGMSISESNESSFERDGELIPKLFDVDSFAFMVDGCEFNTFWSTTESYSDKVTVRTCSYPSDIIWRFPEDQNNAYSIRCIKD